MAFNSDTEEQGQKGADDALAAEIRRFSGFALKGDEAAAASRSFAGFIALLAEINGKERADDGVAGSEDRHMTARQPDPRRTAPRNRKAP